MWLVLLFYIYPIYDTTPQKAHHPFYTLFF